ncbi:MAG: glycosyltransferase family 9 protein [Bacteroidales bacterium]|nr:glycosyltransferase family 9 protein [Bacteroidales bacterium]MDD4216432.1 glycosyltransferase family 9 protein [Bacteroidales bacterium]MDY0143302.1 glycosyltransferase family 9 protein [Bacteroidales bacterium]
MDENEIKFLVIRFSSIGDIVLTTPIVRCLKQQVEGAVVHFLTKPAYASILESNPYIDKVHTLGNFHASINELRDEGFDYIIDLHKNIRTFRFKHKLKIMDFSFDKLNSEKFFLVNFKKNKLPDIHIVDRYFESVKLFDVVNDKKGLDFFIPEDVKYDFHEMFPDEVKFVVFAIGGQHTTKQLPTERIKEICSGINNPIVLLGGKEDQKVGKEISEKLEHVYNLCGITTLNESAYIVTKSTVVITHDTGIMHIAAAFKKDVFSIWGNTVPEFGMYPYLAGANSEIFEVKDLKCRPCSKIGFKKCPKKHFDCMQKQDIQAIIEKTNNLLGK